MFQSKALLHRSKLYSTNVALLTVSHCGERAVCLEFRQERADEFLKKGCSGCPHLPTENIESRIVTFYSLTVPSKA